MSDGRFLIELTTSRQLIKHPLGYLLGCGHEPLPMSPYQVWATTKTGTALIGVSALAAWLARRMGAGTSVVARTILAIGFEKHDFRTLEIPFKWRAESTYYGRSFTAELDRRV
jgi:hypothetical protein